ncbi:MAG: hypothetical protein ACFB4I_23660 [Cyanophyceae cyanobacterium]
MGVTKIKAAITLSILLSSCHVLADDPVLVDYRSSPELTTDSTHPESVLTQAVPETPCPDATPQILDAAVGSFTAANTSQRAYLIELGDRCRVTSPRNTSTTRLAIFSGTELIDHQDFVGFNSIRAVKDSNRDGTDEIVIEASWLGQGYQTISAQLIDIKPDRIAILKDLEQVYLDNFGLPQSQYRVASVISLNSSSSTEGFTRENYVASCSQPTNQRDAECSPYEYISSGDFPTPDEIQKFINTADN